MFHTSSISWEMPDESVTVEAYCPHCLMFLRQPATGVKSVNCDSVVWLWVVFSHCHCSACWLIALVVYEVGEAHCHSLLSLFSSLPLILPLSLLLPLSLSLCWSVIWLTDSFSSLCFFCFCSHCFCWLIWFRASFHCERSHLMRVSISLSCQRT